MIRNLRMATSNRTYYNIAMGQTDEQAGGIVKSLFRVQGVMRRRDPSTFRVPRLNTLSVN
uniref:Uncharacterized protein n=1 Tax=Timema genevievae TaxID=629358 RepID=A0A7R9JPW1_TIMGE|nr:unnamed protein product [Timema genevievae]